MNNIDLNDKVAVVTGGAQGFGLAIAKRISESGANVVIWDKDEEILKQVKLKIVITLLLMLLHLKMYQKQ